MESKGRGGHGRGIVVPHKGVFTDDNLYFHHVGSRNLEKEHIERLVECGIPYYANKLFTPEEDEIIRENWKKFADEHGLDYADAQFQAGKGAKNDPENSARNKERTDFNLQTMFWPLMCERLPHRSAFQVKRRMMLIFDPAVLNKHDKISYHRRMGIFGEELKKLLRLYREKKDWEDVAKEMKRSKKRCENAYMCYLRTHGEVTIVQWRKLWNLVTNLTELPHDEGQPSEYFGKVVRKAICAKNIDCISTYEEYIPFGTIAIRMCKEEKNCRKTWKRIVRKLNEIYTSNVEEEGMRPKMAWTAAYKEVLERLAPIGVEDYSRFLKIITEVTPSNILLEPLREKFYDLYGMETRLFSEGITGFYSGDDTEVGYLFKKTGRCLRRAHKLLFNRLRFRYSLKERLHILSLAFEYQLVKAGIEVAETPSLDDDDDIGAGGRGRAVTKRAAGALDENGQPERSDVTPNMLATNRGFPALFRCPLVEALVVYSVSKYEEWIPPTKWKKYVESEDVLKLFPATTNNDELIGYAELDLFKEYVEFDVEDGIPYVDEAGSSDSDGSDTRVDEGQPEIAAVSDTGSAEASERDKNREVAESVESCANETEEKVGLTKSIKRKKRGHGSKRNKKKKREETGEVEGEAEESQEGADTTSDGCRSGGLGVKIVASSRKARLRIFRSLKRKLEKGVNGTNEDGEDGPLNENEGPPDGDIEDGPEGEENEPKRKKKKKKKRRAERDEMEQ